MQLPVQRCGRGYRKRIKRAQTRSLPAACEGVGSRDLAAITPNGSVVKTIQAPASLLGRSPRALSIPTTDPSLIPIRHDRTRTFRIHRVPAS